MAANLKQYPRWIPTAAGEKIVNTPEDHQAKNPADYEAFLNEKPPSTVAESLEEQKAIYAENLAVAVAEAVEGERERCALLAEEAGGKGRLIAIAIRTGTAESEDEAKKAE
jgi:hypothetical protein